ncbi:hypothetical protein T440DRAFT_500629 [Plenodomus tracheiphilus IPT5]|uniref:DUF3955 domain-containing protein n=1 Tax=Plenodomus tracheiphilus IPT5 TaxID=1408161 RepID=A0A6A7B0A5_9PLEO|nr:hypothetical protein T440DRAFT_500629 [Plenodomus tracheiphilus IPT5]
MIPHREEETTPLSPRLSNVTDDSDFMREDDYLESPSSSGGSSVWEDGKERGFLGRLAWGGGRSGEGRFGGRFGLRGGRDDTGESRGGISGGVVGGGLRHAVGIALLLVTVFLWTASNFLASTIFADDSYSKPYFVTYINTTFFIIPLLPMLAHHLWADRHNISSTPQPLAMRIRELMERRAGKWSLQRDHASPPYPRTPKNRQNSDESAQVLLASSSSNTSKPYHPSQSSSQDDPDALTIRATARLALEFCALWFLANYFAAACLSHTTVASSTILSSTSSIWTLLLGALLHVERFTLPKLLGVAASLAGSFPHKSPRELATGDVMAFVSAVCYGFYTVFMKKRIGSEDRVNMPLFFGFVGLANTLLLWPGLIILHIFDIETFALPPTRRIMAIVMINSASSLVSDFCWAYSMLLTSPLVVTVGLTLTIPLSLVGQMVLDGQYASVWYWVGAGIMVGSFLFINRVEKKEEGLGEEDEERGVFERVGEEDRVLE